MVLPKKRPAKNEKKRYFLKDKVAAESAQGGHARGEKEKIKAEKTEKILKEQIYTIHTFRTMTI